MAHEYYGRLSHDGQMSSKKTKRATIKATKILGQTAIQSKNNLQLHTSLKVTHPINFKIHTHSVCVYVYGGEVAHTN